MKEMHQNDLKYQLMNTEFLSTNNLEDAGHKQKPRILYIDMAYTLKMVTDRELSQEFSSRECGGYFDHVWGIHPFADIPEKRELNYEGFKVNQIQFSKHQTIVEGVSAYYSWLKYCPPLNFLASQIRFVVYLINLVRRERISIVFCTDPYYSGILGLIIKKITKVPIAIWVIANQDDIYKATGAIAMPRLFKWRWIEKIIERIIFKNADLVAGGNQNNLEFALKNGAKLNKSAVFPVGKLIHRQHVLEPTLRNKDELFKKSRSRYHFIYVGRLVELKHPDDVLQAFQLVSKTIPNCTLIMAGDGPMLNQLQTMVLDLNLVDNVYFVGNVSQTQLANLLAGCFAVLSPLTGRSLIESALAGLPIVAYDRDWQGDFISQSGAGIIVPFRGWQKMGEAAIYLTRNPEDALKMGKASREKGLMLCDLEKLFANEQREFNKILNR